LELLAKLGVDVCYECSLVDGNVECGVGIGDMDVVGGDGVQKVVQGALFENWSVRQFVRTSCFE
jgi:hypothetical protein